MTDVRDRDTRAALDIGAAPSTHQPLVTRGLVPAKRDRALAPGPRGKLDLREVPAPDVRRRRGFGLIGWSFIGLVLLPVLASGVYLFFIARDQYTTDTSFAVRHAESLSSSDLSAGGEHGDAEAGEASSSSSGGGSILTGSLNLGGQDAEIVANYIRSRAIIDDISRTLDIRAIYSRPEADFWARLPARASAEELTTYWNKMVSVYIQTSSGIVTVSVSAFRRDDSLALASAVLKASETLVNRISDKIRADAMRTAENEVRNGEAQVKTTLARLVDFRNAKQLINPVKSSEAVSKLLQQLLIDKIDAESKLFVAEKTLSANAPGIGGLRAKLESINAHIGEQKDLMAGGKEISKNLAATLSEFEQLELQKQFAERMYGFARDGVERARVLAERQQIYLAAFAPPAMPQDFSFPLRWTDFSLISLAVLMTWVCLVTITASIKDHRL